MTNRGGRPPHHEGETKKAAIAVRTAPSIRDALKAAAAAAGRSVTQEVEARLSASLERDAGQRSAETELLLNRIAAEIAEIEKMPGMKRWHRDRTTAGAVLEMFARRPKSWVRTDDPSEDEIVKQALEELFNVQEERAKLERALVELGIQPQNSRSLNALAPLMPSRWRERENLEKVELSPQMRNLVNTLLDQLETIDAREEAANVRYRDAVQPYWEAEDKGRHIYRTFRRGMNIEAAQRGNYSHVEPGDV